MEHGGRSTGDGSARGTSRVRPQTDTPLNAAQRTQNALAQRVAGQEGSRIAGHAAGGSGLRGDTRCRPWHAHWQHPTPPPLPPRSLPLSPPRALSPSSSPILLPPTPVSSPPPHSPHPCPSLFLSLTRGPYRGRVPAWLVRAGVPKQLGFSSLGRAGRPDVQVGGYSESADIIAL